MNRGVEREGLGRELEAELRKAGVGDLRFDRLARVLYSSDASSFQVEPLGVACPRDADEVAAVVGVCGRLGVPISARAGGTGLAGQALGDGLVLDTARHMRGLVISGDGRRAIAEPGVVLDRLNREAAKRGLRFGPDPASSDRACVGGVVATNATGARSVKQGMASDHLKAAEAVLSDGSRVDMRQRFPSELEVGLERGGREAAAHLAVARILREGVEDIRRDFPRYWRRAGGYNLDRVVQRALGSDVLPWWQERPMAKWSFRFTFRSRTSIRVDSERPEATRVTELPLDDLIPGPINLADLLAGSEGSLAIATSLELGLVPLPGARGLLILAFDSLAEALEAVPVLLESRPSAIELVDRSLLQLARQAPGHARDLSWIEGDPAALLIVEQEGGSEAHVAGLLRGTRAKAEKAGIRGSARLALRPEDQARVWRARKAGLGLLARRRGDHKPVAGIEDTAVPPERLAGYMAEVGALLRELAVEASFYAHASAGCIHVRPILNLKTARGVSTLDHLSEAVFELVLKHGGVPSSEHGDGLARSGFNARLFGPAVYGMFKDIKRAFDPERILNPGKVVGPLPSAEQLRYGPGYRAVSPPSQLAYPLDGDLAHAVEQCSGIGVCRKLDVGAMCPSYMLTLEERDSTRGRANALRAALDGRLPDGGLAGDAVHQAMDLCIGCKACKTECPAGVDMARLEIETKAARGAARGFPLRAHVFARIHTIDRLLSRAPRLANRLLASRASRALAPRLGIHPDRRLPGLAVQTLDRWWGEQRSPQSKRSDTGSSRRLVLFADTFTTFHEPEIGQAVVQLARTAGYRVEIPARRRCCGRPALSQGLVDLARRDLRANLALLAPHARAGRPILVPEPSCASVFRDELPDLLTGAGERDDALRLSEAVLTVEEWLAGLPAGALELRPGPQRALLHVHCHQRALVGIQPTLDALALIPSLRVEEPDAGCCGMAGAFGYELEHRDASLAMGRRKLAPAIEALDPRVPILAPGTSCRHQVADLTGRRALHPVQLLAGQLESPARRSSPNG